MFYTPVADARVGRPSDMNRPCRLLRVALAGGALMAGAGCAATTDPEPPGTVPVAGAWSYSGQQSGAAVQLSGSVDFVSRSAVSFDGSADINEGAGGIAQRRLVGPVLGRFTSGAVIEFDITLGVLLRRHVARVVADTIAGSWFELPVTGATAGTAIGATGSFRAIRRR